MKRDTVSISTLKPYWRNPRRIDEAVEVVTESISRYGYTTPIAVDEENVIVAGHARYRALQRLGYEQIEIIILDHLTQEQAREYRLVDNRTADESDWDEKKLLDEILGSSEPAFVSSFFRDDEIMDLLPPEDYDKIFQTVNPTNPEEITEVQKR